DCDNWKFTFTRMISERDSSKPSRTSLLLIENSSNWEVAFCYIEGATAYGMGVTQDTEKRYIEHLAAGALTPTITVPDSIDLDAYGEYVLVGLRENQQVIESVDTGADTLTITDHGAVDGQLY